MDGNEQMNQAVSAFVNTAQEYGQHLPDVAATNNPSWDRNWLYDLIPTLRCTQQRMYALTADDDATSNLIVEIPVDVQAAPENADNERQPQLCQVLVLTSRRAIK
jgi:hypothetical protein